MFDLADLLLKPAHLLLGMLRVLWWLGWDFMVRTVGWSIGWLIFRILTLGRFPHERLGGIDEANEWHATLVELIGLAALAWAIWALSGHGPRL